MKHAIKNAFRDERSGAVIIDDDEAYMQARNRKRLAEEKNNLESEVSTMREELNNIKAQMNQLLQSKSQD